NLLAASLLNRHSRSHSMAQFTPTFDHFHSSSTSAAAGGGSGMAGNANNSNGRGPTFINASSVGSVGSMADNNGGSNNTQLRNSAASTASYGVSNVGRSSSYSMLPPPSGPFVFLFAASLARVAVLLIP